MNKLFGENGFLNKEGEKFVSDFKKSLQEILFSDEANMMTSAEVRTLGSVLSNMVGDMISRTISSRTELSEKYNSMTDENFDKFLRDKYDTGNDTWCFKPLGREEMARGSKMLHDQITKLLEEGMKNVPKQSHNCIIISDKKRFK